MSRGLLQDFVQDPSGNALVGVEVEVFIADGLFTTQAALWDAAVGGNSLPNPLTTASRGYFSAYAETGEYDLRVTTSGGSFDIPNVPVFDADELTDLSGSVATAVQAASDAAASATEAADILDSTIQTLPTLAALQASRLPVGSKVILEDRENSRWRAVTAGSEGAPDGYGLIAGTGVDYILDESFPYKFEWFGYQRGVRSAANSAAAQACIDFMPDTGGSVQYIAGGVYPLSITLYKPCTIFGEGTVIPEVLGGYAYTTDPTHPNAVLNREGHLYAINWGAHKCQSDFDSVVNNGAIADRTTVRDNGLFNLNKLDHYFIDEVTAEHFRREVINFTTSCREANINVRTRWCGDATRGYPVFRIDETDNTNDAHNNIRFNDSYVIFSLGTAFYFDTKTSGEGRTATDLVRNIFLNNTMVHGIVSQIDGAPYTFVDAHKRALMIDVNDAELIHMTNKTRLHVGGFDAPTVSFKAGSTSARSRRHFLTDTIISNHYSESSGTYSTPTPGLFPAVKISGVVDVTFNDNLFLGHNKLIDAAAGATVYYGLGNNNENSVDPDTTVGNWVQTGYGKYTADEYEAGALNVTSGALPARSGGDPLTIAFNNNAPRMFVENVGWTYIFSGTRTDTKPPIPALAPRYIGEIYRDTSVSPPGMYAAYGTSAGQWTPISPSGKSCGSTVYDFAVHGGAISTINLEYQLPDNSSISRAWYEVIAPFASAGAATVAFGVATDDAAGLKAATAYNDASYSSGYHDFAPDGTAATFTNKTTAARRVVMTIAGAALTAGKVRVWFEYVTSE